MSKTTEWFTVDRKGLARKLSRKTKAFAIFELVQNAWDATAVTTVKIATRWHKGKLTLSVEDNSPIGFQDLSHAYTLFAPSKKEANPLQRGRFNAGEKFVFSLCDTAVIRSTTGTITFSQKGRVHSQAKTQLGTLVECTIPMSREEAQELELAVKGLLSPENIATFHNGIPLKLQTPVVSFTTKLKTEQANDAGILRQVDRTTTVQVYRAQTAGWIYEMGIPVMETGDPWHYNVQQKVPLTIDREAVPPSFVRSLRVQVVNHCRAYFTTEIYNQPWVAEAIEHTSCTAEAVKDYMQARFTDRRVAYDPTDQEANKLAVSKGYTVVYGNTLSGTAWKRVKAERAILPAGQVTPSPKPFSPGAPPFKLLSTITPEMERVKQYAQALAKLVLNSNITVTFADDRGWFPAAVYGPSGQLIFNVAQLGKGWFDLASKPESENRERINRLLIHEWGHHYESDHLSSEYHEALCQIGAKLVEIAENQQTPKL